MRCVHFRNNTWVRATVNRLILEKEGGNRTTPVHHLRSSLSPVPASTAMEHTNICDHFCCWDGVRVKNSNSRSKERANVGKWHADTVSAIAAGTPERR
jgi:hypothetical protein